MPCLGRNGYAVFENDMKVWMDWCFMVFMGIVE